MKKASKILIYYLFKEGEKTMEVGVMTVREVATYLKIGVTNTYELVKREGFPLIRVGRQMRVPKKALEEWVNKQHNGKESGLIE